MSYSPHEMKQAERIRDLNCEIGKLRKQLSENNKLNAEMLGETLANRDAEITDLRKQLSEMKGKWDREAMLFEKQLSERDALLLEIEKNFQVLAYEDEFLTYLSDLMEDDPRWPSDSTKSDQSHSSSQSSTKEEPKG